MNKPALNEILNNKIGDLVDLLHTGLKAIAEVYNLNTDQLSEIERDFIARLAFSAIKYGVNKEEEEDCENCSAKDRCSFKEPEKKEPDKKTVPDEVWKALRFVKNHCDLDCDDCPFGSSAGIFCHLDSVPSDWEV